MDSWRAEIYCPWALSVGNKVSTLAVARLKVLFTGLLCVVTSWIAFNECNSADGTAENGRSRRATNCSWSLIGRKPSLPKREASAYQSHCDKCSALPARVNCEKYSSSGREGIHWWRPAHETASAASFQGFPVWADTWCHWRDKPNRISIQWIMDLLCFWISAWAWTRQSPEAEYPASVLSK